ncbi:MAG: NADH-quinone oxidoreductase subunit A [Acidimicrobiia bacterium]
MDQYLPVLAMLVLAALFAGLSFVASKLLAPRKPTQAKSAPYESGIVPTTTPGRFPVQFYLVAMIFIIFDIEIIFIYPWAVIYRSLGAYGLWEMLIFSFAVLVSFIYLLGNGALDWGPSRRMRPATDSAGATAADRSARSTIKRVPSKPAVTPGEAA